MKTKKKKSRSKLIKELDVIFSIYTRILNSEDGFSTCVTCKKSLPWQQQQNGHFYSRSRYPTRWDEDNCNVQCIRCNIFLKGNYIIYTKYMIDKYGRKFVDNLEIKSLSEKKYKTLEIENMILNYTKEVDELIILKNYIKNA